MRALHIVLAAGWIGWASPAHATPPEGLWIGSTTTGKSAKVTILEVNGSTVKGSVELQRDNMTFTDTAFTGQLRAGLLTGSGSGLTLSLAIDGDRMRGKVVVGGKSVQVSFLSDSPAQLHMMSTPAPRAAVQVAPVAAPVEEVPVCVACATAWALVDRDPYVALAIFDKAMTDDPQMAEAWYGRGYAQLALRDREAAAASLCRANELADVQLARDIQGVLSMEKISCIVGR